MKVSRFEIASIKRAAKTVAVYEMQAERINKKIDANNEKVQSLKEKIEALTYKRDALSVESEDLCTERDMIMSRIEAYTKPLEEQYGKSFKEIINDVTGTTESIVEEKFEEELEEPVEVKIDESATVHDSSEMYKADVWPYGVAFNRTEDID